MKDFKFEPKVGMVTEDSYLFGINEDDLICQRGVIEYVGRDYFILRARNRPFMIVDTQYYLLEEVEPGWF